VGRTTTNNRLLNILKFLYLKKRSGENHYKQYAAEYPLCIAALHRSQQGLQRTTAFFCHLGENISPGSNFQTDQAKQDRAMHGVTGSETD